MREYNIVSEFKLDEKVEYFVSYYLYTIELYKKGSSKFNIFNLHSLCKIIIEEISKNNNNRNLNFFQSKLGNISSIDSLIKNNYKYKVNEIINNMTSNKQYALIVANNLISDLDNGKYGKEICCRIEKLLFSKKVLTDIKEELKYLINSLIVEYIIYGYNQEEIENIIYNIFSKYQIYNEFVTTQFPIQKELTDNDKIKDFINNLSIEDRINALKLYFEKEKSKFYYLFNIKGIVGDLLDVHLNNVNIYNWKTNHKFDVEIQKSKPAIYEVGDFKKDDIHCSILIESVSKDSKFEKIKQELDDALDILNIYHNLQCKIEIDYSKYVVFDENKQIIEEGMTHEFDEDFKREVRPLNYNYDDNYDEINQKYNKYSEYILNNANDSSQIIKHSIRYYRKAKETTRLEDKILNYWICIENIFKIQIDLSKSILDNSIDDKKLNNIYSITPYIILKNETIAQYWYLHDYFMNKSIYEENSGNKILTAEEIKKLQFNIGSISLLEFIKNYELLNNKFKLKLDQDIYMKYFEILNDTKVATAYINESIRKSKEIILLLYRYRNMIVHNAQYDITFSEFYIKQFDLLAARLLNAVIDEYYKSKGEKTLENIIVNEYINKKQLTIELKNKKLKEWFYSQ